MTPAFAPEATADVPKAPTAGVLVSRRSSASVRALCLWRASEVSEAWLAVLAATDAVGLKKDASVVSAAGDPAETHMDESGDENEPVPCGRASVVVDVWTRGQGMPFVSSPFSSAAKEHARVRPRVTMPGAPRTVLATEVVHSTLPVARKRAVLVTVRVKVPVRSSSSGGVATGRGRDGSRGSDTARVRGNGASRGGRRRGCRRRDGRRGRRRRS